MRRRQHRLQRLNHGRSRRSLSCTLHRAVNKAPGATVKTAIRRCRRQRGRRRRCQFCLDARGPDPSHCLIASNRNAAIDSVTPVMRASAASAAPLDTTTMDCTSSMCRTRLLPPQVVRYLPRTS